MQVLLIGWCALQNKLAGLEDELKGRGVGGRRPPPPSPNSMLGDGIRKSYVSMQVLLVGWSSLQNKLAWLEHKLKAGRRGDDATAHPLVRDHPDP